MNLNSLKSARIAWHDCFYQSRVSVLAVAEETAALGCSVQRTERDSRTYVAMHQAVCGRIQKAIQTLPLHLRTFGDWMYSPLATDDQKDFAEALIYQMAHIKFEMTLKKKEKARAVARAVLFRYRRMHQGGQSEGIDPLAKPEHFRTWVELECGVKLSEFNFVREWQEYIDACFNVCNDLDKEALKPVAQLIGSMRQAA